MTYYITKRTQVIFRCVFEGILAYLVSGTKSTLGLPWTSLDFPGLFYFVWKLCLIKYWTSPDHFLFNVEISGGPEGVIRGGISYQ